MDGPASITEIRVVAARPEGHAPHRLHAPDRAWPETNCAIDLWIELLPLLGRDPLPLLGLAAGMEWEGDHFTFLKPSHEDLLNLAGVVMHELALWDDLVSHVAVQLGRGAVPMLEVDAFFLPDTQGTAWRTQHTKSSIGIVAIDRAAGWVDYVHNTGLHRLSGEDYVGIFARPVIFPYAEFARLASPVPEAAQRRRARAALARHAACRMPGNPITRFAAAVPGLTAAMEGDPARIHMMNFNTARQLGANFALLADHLEWLGGDPSSATTLSNAAKSLQFQMARAARRGRNDPAIPAILDRMANTWCDVAVELERVAVGVS